MIPKIWRLSENSGDDNLGLTCTEQGLMLGRTALIERRDGRFVVRERSEIEQLLGCAYRSNVVVDRLMPGLATVAAALNANDQALARIAAVHLRIPDLPDQAARDAMKAADVFIQSVDWNPALHPRADTPPNPGWFAPTGGAGGGIFGTRPSQNHVLPPQRSDASANAGDDWVKLRPGPQRIDEFADYLRMDRQRKTGRRARDSAGSNAIFTTSATRAAGRALYSALTVLLRPGTTKVDRQLLLDQQLDVFTRADPGAYARTRDWASGADFWQARLPSVVAGDAARGAGLGGVDQWLGQARTMLRSTAP